MIAWTESGPAHRALLRRVQGWIGLDRGWDEANTRGMAVGRAGRIVGGVVFHEWNPDAETICMSAGGEPGWMTREAIFAAHDYAFGFCQAVVWQVAETNTRMRRHAERLGYVGHVIPRLRGRHEADVIYIMTDAQWGAHPINARYNSGKGSAARTARVLDTQRAEYGKAERTEAA